MGDGADGAEMTAFIWGIQIKWKKRSKKMGIIFLWISLLRGYVEWWKRHWNLSKERCGQWEYVIKCE